MAADRIRTTISLDPEVHAIFVTMADAAGTSVSRCMGDWLADTAEGAQFVTSKMVEARRAPKTVMREMQAMARGLVDEIDAQANDMRFKSLGEGAQAQAELRQGAAAQAPAVGQPPSSPTGVKSPSKGRNSGSKVGSALVQAYADTNGIPSASAHLDAIRRNSRKGGKP